MRSILCLIILLTSAYDALANACLSHIAQVEKQEGIPRNLLVAMARVESGRYNQSNKMVEPWPWTVQSGGKSNYFKTKAEAVNHVKSLMRKGVKNIDVGCMQMNIEHHGHKFKSVEEMFEPANNVAQGAKYLKQLKMDKNVAWSTAAGNYHSFTPQHHNRYKTLVLKNLSLVNREQGKRGVEMDAVSGPRGSLYPSGPSSGPKVVNASLYHYSRGSGMKAVNRGSSKPTHKTVKVSSKSRIAQMNSNGVYDLAFMNQKKQVG